MNTDPQIQITSTLNHLFDDSKFDGVKMAKGVAKSIFRPMQPADFEGVYLSISKEQGAGLKQLILDNDLKNIVEFGTSFGISTLFMASAVIENGGHIISTELLDSKARKAMDNFKKAGVNHLIDVKTGDAMETLKGHNEPIDLLFLDGWKDLYLPLFDMLQSNFHTKTIVYVDNADMKDAKLFLETVRNRGGYDFESLYGGKAVLIRSEI